MPSRQHRNLHRGTRGIATCTDADNTKAAAAVALRTLTSSTWLETMQRGWANTRRSTGNRDQVRLRAQRAAFAPLSGKFCSNQEWPHLSSDPWNLNVLHGLHPRQDSVVARRALAPHDWPLHEECRDDHLEINKPAGSKYVNAVAMTEWERTSTNTIGMGSRLDVLAVN